MRPIAQLGRAAARFREDARWRSFGWMVIVLAVLAFCYIVFVLTLPPPDVWVTLEARSESVAFTVVNPEFATFRAAGMRAVAIDGDFDACVDAIVIPKLGARMEFRRGEESFFRITLDPAPAQDAAVLLRDLTQPGAGTSPPGSVVLSADARCPGKPPSRLPLWGAATFGEEARPAGPMGDLTPGVLAEGRLAVFARAHQRLLGLSFPAVIYPVTTFDLPAGAVLETPKAADVDIWTGLVTVDPVKTGLTVQASSRTRRLMLGSTRAFALEGHAQQEIDIGRYAQFLSDPNVVQIQVLAGIFFFLAQSTASVIGFLTRHFVRE